MQSHGSRGKGIFTNPRGSRWSLWKTGHPNLHWELLTLRSAASRSCRSKGCRGRSPKDLCLDRRQLTHQRCFQNKIRWRNRTIHSGHIKLCNAGPNVHVHPFSVYFHTECNCDQLISSAMVDFMFTIHTSPKALGPPLTKTSGSTTFGFKSASI